ncbi:unnamed protein product [Urochloa decumbens]|uniref:NB-ARC domain-containing protein n=1 Tax=Urochloa decumbens TaxID=240449 RepID=A0ABC9AU22_9POAL
MDMIISAVLGEAITRSISLVISKSFKQRVPDVEDSLQRILLRAQVIIDEATGRHITNQAMLQQLGMLRDAMYQGNYILDASRYQSHDEDGKDSIVSHSLSLCIVNYLRGTSYSNRNTEILEQLQYALDNLSSMIVDVKELVGFLKSYPTLYRQPYSMHLLLSNCMFGRQMEEHLVISFLLNTQPHSSEELEVLPIVGPYEVGKSTLVYHVCKDERVCDHFSKVLLLRGQDFINYGLATLSKGCAVQHENHVLYSNKDKRLLLVVELDGDVNEDAWSKLFSSCKQHVPTGSKIIVTSRSDKIIKFGTTPPLHLNYLSREAFWYFFKTLTFGSMDPKTQPRFAHVAMEIGRMLSVCFIRANFMASLLRNNFDIHFWCKVLTYLRWVIHKNVSKYGGHPFDLINQNRPVHLRRMARPSEEVVLHSRFQCSSSEQVPKISIQDVLYGNVKPHGKFEFLSWRSQIPPYYSYVTSCEIREQKTTATKRKRSTKENLNHRL